MYRYAHSHKKNVLAMMHCQYVTYPLICNLALPPFLVRSFMLRGRQLPLLNGAESEIHTRVLLSISRLNGSFLVASTHMLSYPRTKARSFHIYCQRRTTCTRKKPGQLQQEYDTIIDRSPLSPISTTIFSTTITYHLC